MENKIRHYQNTLYIVGTGVIAIGIWSILKSAMFAMFRTDSLNTWLEEGVHLQKDEYFVFYIILIAIVVLDLGIRVYIGLTARAEGKGKKKLPVYLVLALVLAALSFISLATFLLQIILVFLPVGTAVNIAGVDISSVLTAAEMQAAEYETAENMGASFIVELTSFVTLCQMVFAGIRIRFLQRALRKKG